MATSFDQTTDYSSREFTQFIKKANFIPEYVKNAKVAAYEDYTAYPSTAFADEGNRAFPKSSAANTFLSYVHLLNKSAALEEKYNKEYVQSVEKRIKEAAEIWGNLKDLETYQEKYVQKEAEAYVPKAVFTTKIGEDEVELFPYKTAADLAQCARQFASEYKKLPFAWRKEAAVNFVKAAGEMGVDELPDIICKYAGMFYFEPTALKTELERRALRSHVKEAKEVYLKMAELVEEYDSAEDCMKTAEIAYEMEKQAGIHDNPKTASLFGDPVDMFFSLPIEKLAQKLNVVKIGGEYFDMNDLLNVDESIYKEALGIDKVADSAELQDIMATVPYSDMQLFRELSGVKAV